MHQVTLVAVDTNVLLRLAGGDAATVDAWELIRDRLVPVQFIALPTVLEELNVKRTDTSDQETANVAHKSLVELRSRWKFFPADANAVEEAIIQHATQNIRQAGLLPYEELNDSRIIAEASVLKCLLLVSRDSHLLEVDRDKLSYLFRKLDLPVPIIVSPQDLLRKFYR